MLLALQFVVLLMLLVLSTRMTVCSIVVLVRARESYLVHRICTSPLADKDHPVQAK